MSTDTIIFFSALAGCFALCVTIIVICHVPVKKPPTKTKYLKLLK